MEILREKNYKPKKSAPRLKVVALERGERYGKAPMYDRTCRHYIDKIWTGKCELGFMMCNCNKDCKLNTNNHNLQDMRDKI